MSSHNNVPAIQGLPAIEGVDKLTGEDLAVLQYVLQATQTVNIVKMRKLEESKIPTGVKPLKLTVTSVPMKFPLYPPWISFSLVNNGAGGITVWVNTPVQPLEEGVIASGDTYSVDMTYPVIHTLYLRADSGTTAAVVVYGKEGRIS